MSIELSELSLYNPLELFSGRIEPMMATLRQLVKVPGVSEWAWRRGAGGGRRKGGRGIVKATLAKVPGARGLGG